MDKVLLSIDLLELIIGYLAPKDIKMFLLSRKNIYRIGYNLRFLKNVTVDNIATINRLAYQLYPSPSISKLTLKNIVDANIHLPILPKKCILLNCTISCFFRNIPHKLSTSLEYLVVDASTSDIFLDFQNMPNIKSINIRCSSIHYSKDHLMRSNRLNTLNVDTLYTSDLTNEFKFVKKNTKKNNRYNHNYVQV